MSDIYTKDALRVIEEAEKVSDELGHDYLCTGHMLIGMLRVNDSLAAKLLATAGVSLSLTEMMFSHHHVGIRPIPTDNSPKPLMPKAKKAVELALSEYLSRRLTAIDSAQLLLAILADSSSEASTALAQFAVTHDRMQYELQHPKILETPDGRVRIVMRGNNMKITINAGAEVGIYGAAVERGSFVFNAVGEHVIVIEPTH